MLRSKGCWACVRQIQANEYGTAQRRARLYILCLRADMAALEYGSEAEMQELCASVLSSIRLPHPPLQDFLLPLDVAPSLSYA